MKTLDGPRIASVTAVPHRDARGAVVGLYVMTTDVTMQRTMLHNARAQDDAKRLGP